MRQCSKCRRHFEGNESVCPDDGTVLSSSVPDEDQAVGKTLDGKYRIDGFLKRGGMGAVYRGTHLMLSKPVAIKLIKPELVSSSDVVQRFLREARAAAHLSHANIVTVHDLGQTADGTLYIAMELVDGSSLKELIQTEGAWEPRRAVRLAKGIASALALAHKNGVVHRDLKPQNIMVFSDSDGGEVPKLLDFGIAKTFEPTSPALTSTGMVLGTPHYMSAEQAKGMPADQRSDLYALGVILYEMLVGKVPFDDTSIPQILIKHLNEPPRPPSALNRGIPDALERVVLRCLEKDPDKRYQNAEELMRALDTVSDTAVEVPAALEQRPAVSAPPPTIPETRETTMAGAAAVAPMHPTSSATATVRAHEARVQESRGGGARLLLLGVVVVALALIAMFVLRGRGEDGVSQASVPPATMPEESPSPLTSPAPSDAESPPTIAEPPVTSTAAVTVPPPAPAPVEPEPSRQQPPREPVQPEPAPLPQKPAVSVECEGVRDGCAALRHAIIEACKRDGLPMARPMRSDVHLRVDVEEVEARREEQFGTTFVVRTYAVEARGESRHFEQEVNLAPHMVTFDARLGREKLREQSRRIASDVVARVQEYWARQTR